ncbi:MAG: hypothetical protein WBP22_02465 [Candidatus Saccharimonas sp.]
MTTNTATSDPTPAHLITKFDPKTYQVIPVEKDKVADSFEEYTLAEHLIYGYILKYFDVSGDFVNRVFDFRDDIRAAYWAAEASGWVDYGPRLPKHEAYLEVVKAFNTGLASKAIRLRCRDIRPEAPSPTTNTIAALPALTPGSATLDDVIATVNATALNVNALVALMTANQQTQPRQPGRIRRLGSWLATERQPGAHA